jgi:hypothetical protein
LLCCCHLLLLQGLLDVIVSDDYAAVKVVRLRIIDDSGMGAVNIAVLLPHSAAAGPAGCNRVR